LQHRAKAACSDRSCRNEEPIGKIIRKLSHQETEHALQAGEADTSSSSISTRICHAMAENTYLCNGLALPSFWILHPAGFKDGVTAFQLQLSLL
jgi:hypothetical protein